MRAGLKLLSLTVAVFTAISTLGAAQSFAAEPALSKLDDADFYYMAESPFVEGTKWETGLSAGYIFSDPYLNIGTLTASGYYLTNRSFAFGLELTGYSSSPSRAAEGLDATLGDYGFTSDKLSARPEFGAVGVMRFTPMTGMVNFFSSRVVMTDISFVLRGGTTKYSNLPLAPLIGTGVLVHLGFNANVGLDAGLIWDLEHPPTKNWQSRVGFRIGPTFRF